MTLGTRILLLISERIGDVIFCTPAIQLLRSQLPTMTLDVLAPNTVSASVLDHNPTINKIIINPELSSLKKLAQDYDSVIDFHNSKQTRVYAEQLKLPLFQSPRTQAGKHQSQVATEFIASLLQTEIPVLENYLLYPQSQHFNHVEQLLLAKKVDLSKDILIGCHMGSNQIARRGLKFWKKKTGHKTWSVKNFIALEKMLRQKNPSIRLVLTGSKNETTLCRKLQKQSHRVIDLSGKTSVLEIAALMRYCKIFLTGDTGPLHIACSTPVAVLALFGPTVPAETGPYPLQTQHRVIQQKNMEHIHVSTVFAALEGMLA